MTTCSSPSCAASHKTSRWDAIRADREGWFHQNNGSAWCLDHNPPWLAEWRAKKRGEVGPPAAVRPAVGGTFDTRGEFQCARCVDWVLQGERAGYINEQVCCISCWTKFHSEMI
jgi:hypothetical protein